MLECFLPQIAQMNTLVRREEETHPEDNAKDTDEHLYHKLISHACGIHWIFTATAPRRKVIAEDSLKTF